MKSKYEIRLEIWKLLEEERVAIFPFPLEGRIPNFIGANIAADKLDELSLWRKARVIKTNPDSPQKWIREKALKHGKTVYMAVPRLKNEKCFLKIDPKKIINYTQASTIKGAFRYGEALFPDEMEMIDVVVIGSVAVNQKGGKIGKGGGFSDLEYSIGRKFGIINEDTPTITTIHQLQLVDYEIPMEVHDVSIDFIITRNKVIRTKNIYSKPNRIYWNIIGNKIFEIPILQKVKAQNKL